MARLGLLCALACVVLVASKQHSEKAMHHAAKSGRHKKVFRHGIIISSSAEGKIPVSTVELHGPSVTVDFPKEKAEYLLTLMQHGVTDDEGEIDWTIIQNPIPAPPCTAAHLGIVTGMIDLHLKQKKQLAKEEGWLNQNNDELKERVNVVLQQIDAISDADFGDLLHCMSWLQLTGTLFDMEGVPEGAKDLVSMHPIVEKLEIKTSLMDLSVDSLRTLDYYRVALNEEGRQLAALPPMPESDIAYAAEDMAWAGEWRRENARVEAFIKKYFKTDGNWLQKQEMKDRVIDYLPKDFMLPQLYRMPGGHHSDATIENIYRGQDVNKMIAALKQNGRLQISRDEKEFVLV